MYILINFLGKQYKIFKNLIIIVDKVNLKINSLIILNNIILFKSNRFFIINKNILNRIIIFGRIISHNKFKKINILKFKRRKGYKKKIGFKKSFTKIIIENINLNFFLYNFNNGSKKIRRFF
ncbi:hypothetical protein NDNC_0750 [Candidatus Nasuia deltocephalinicola]|uniref:Large ribosomal subunit protein bL21 n=1 Tax=Candidatus Nasuia deltocephalincola TaxID=1160784 RepID=A0A974WKE6_9PROT|nr:50S ribosomal protein L21 [Candidatus Nasuia deltocephalinicola]WKD87156.1 50S ribosomal protein L21 [Candidatus Nasuia deltocephalinicola]BEH03909.1 hypothetical protein NDNC_0750 [Candidatus Nasuia deltocephalinicola]